MTVYKLLLPFRRPVLTSNEARSRHHWSVQRNAKQVVETAVWALAKQQLVPLINMCTVCLTWYPPDRRKRDPDSLAPTLKASLDGLTGAGVLLDDDAQHVAGVLLRIGPVARPARIELTIVDSGWPEGLRELVAC